MQTSLWSGSTLSKTQRKVLGNLKGCALSLQIAAIKSKSATPLVLICSSTSDVSRLARELRYLCPNEPLLVFRDYETLPYDMFSAHQDIISARLEFLSRAPFLENGIVLTSLGAITQRLSPVKYIQSNTFVLSSNQATSINELKDSFVARGYSPVQQVFSHGEFAARGSIIDVFPMGLNNPLRIDFIDQEIDSISYFDPHTQRSTSKIDAVNLLPAHEFSLDKASIESFCTKFRENFPGYDFLHNPVYQSVSKGILPAGIEYYLPLFFKDTASFFDYISPKSNVLTIGDMEQGTDNYLNEINQRYLEIRGRRDHPPLQVEMLFLTRDEIMDSLKQYPSISLLESDIGEAQSKLKGFNNAPCLDVPNIAINRLDKKPGSNLVDFVTDFCQNQSGRILITALSEGRRQSLRETIPHELIEQFGLAVASSVDEFLNSDAPLMLTIAPFSQGMIIDKSSRAQAKEAESKGFSCKSPIAFLTETELLGFKVIRQKTRKHSSTNEQDAFIRDLTDLKEGQLVVHIDHGIGIYRGLETTVINSITYDMIRIEYKNGDTVTIPITALHKISRYAGNEESPELSSLGSKKWHKKRDSAAKKVIDVAADLLDIYSQRNARPGFAFKVDEHALEEFVSSFPYEETEDQLRAIEQTLEDMQKPIAMDRLICGDVGFGKTEVALRAAFVAAYNGKQVAILVPTTILAKQHFDNFIERFASTGLRVEMLCSFVNQTEQKKICKDILDGKVDIVIGTHRLITGSLKFKDLGLLIIDEEHRFGVAQKEKLKALRAEVDLLTLTATPIPRTLNMALEGMRELSIIATPPENRLAVKTFVYENSKELTREAIMRELRRGGQVYYLHNDVSSMDKLIEDLHKLVPEANIRKGHGQMDKKELQKIMQDFYNQRFNVLVCSTIIENGLDIPTANTIIIDRADLLGLSQLHQIRGRVGRSHHQAYAYLFTPPKQLLTHDAKARLEAISNIDELGAGFSLASHDLEIRGAGELLGSEQSGQIESIGFSLYMDMLNNAVKSIKEGKLPSLEDLNRDGCDVDMQLSALLPSDYIPNVNIRLSLYKRIASCSTFAECDDLRVEIIDRFGKLPHETMDLFDLAKIKLIASMLGIKKIRGDSKGVSIQFDDKHNVDTKYIIDLVKLSPNGEYTIPRPNVLRCNVAEGPKLTRMKIIARILMLLKQHSAVKDQPL